MDSASAGIVIGAISRRGPTPGTAFDAAAAQHQAALRADVPTIAT